MRLLRVGFLLAVLCTGFAPCVIFGCSGDASSDDSADPPLPDRHRDGSDDGVAPIDGAFDSSKSPVDTGIAQEAAVDAALPEAPFSQYLVLRLEADAPGGLNAVNVWRDLSSAHHNITLVNPGDAGVPTIEAAGTNGAKVMVFDGVGPVFDVGDPPDLRFGATDDFFVVTRATITAIPTGSGSCSFHYIFGKYAADGLSGAHLRVCGNTALTLIGSLKLVSNDLSVVAPSSFATTLDVLSFGRNQSGKRIETHAGGVAAEEAVATPVDVSSVGTSFGIGGARTATGGTFGPWLGRINRVYVYHAPPGTLTSDDFASIRVFVKNAAPLP